MWLTSLIEEHDISHIDNSMDRIIPDEIVLDEEPDERSTSHWVKLKRFLRKLYPPTILKSRDDK